jgi:hypothetical protein
MERILINNEWYVKESSQEPEEDIKVDFMFSNSCIVETDKFCFEATRCMKDGNVEYYPDISIDVTKKEGDRKDWGKEYWDGTRWMRGVLNGDTECLAGLAEYVTDAYNQKVFMKLLEKLDEIGWL